MKKLLGKEAILVGANWLVAAQKHRANGIGISVPESEVEEAHAVLLQSMIR